MEFNQMMHSYILQPNEVFEIGQLRITNIGKKEASVTTDLLKDFDCLMLSSGPRIERGLEFRLRVAD